MPPVRNEKMMQTAPSAPSVPATVAARRAGAVEAAQALPLREQHDDRNEHADQEVGDADAQQRPHRAAQLDLPLVQHRAIDAPRQHCTRNER